MGAVIFFVQSLKVARFVPNLLQNFVSAADIAAEQAATATIHEEFAYDLRANSVYAIQVFTVHNPAVSTWEICPLQEHLHFCQGT